MHPDVRKNLLEAKAFTEAARVLAVLVGLNIDRSLHHPDAAAREQANDFVALLTPVIKAYYTDMGVDIAIKMQQMYGGHGYIREWGMEQFVRDARISMLYEGANAIQALDLVGRKLPQNGGRAVRAFFAMVQAEIEEAKSRAGAWRYCRAARRCGWQAAAGHRAGSPRTAFANPDEAGGAATDYLRIFALVSLGWMWLKLSRTAHREDAARRRQRSNITTPRSRRPRFFAQKMLPEVDSRFAEPHRRQQDHDGDGSGAVLDCLAARLMNGVMALAGASPRL